MSNTPQIKQQATAIAASSNDQQIKQLAEIIQLLCVEIDRVEHIANDAYGEARRAKRK
jgi:hypothetical protein